MKRPQVLLLAAVAVVLVAGAASPALLRRWRERDPNRRLGPAPTVVGDECGVGHPPGALLAVDAATGDLRWSRMVGGGTSGWDRPTGLAVADGTVAVTVGDQIAGFAASDGSHRWCAGGPVVTGVDDRLFTVQDGDTVELDPHRGRATAGRAQVLAGLLEDAAGDVTVDEQRAPYPRHAVALWAHDRGGTELWWRAEVPGFDVTVADPVVLVVDQSGGTGDLDSRPGHFPTHVLVTAYELSTGDRAWSVRVPFTSDLVLAGDRFLTHSGVDRIMVRDVGTGRLVWDRPHDNPGRTQRFSEPATVVAAAADPASSTLFVLLASEEPYRD